MDRRRKTCEGLSLAGSSARRGCPLSCANGEWKVGRWVDGWMKPRKGPRRRGSGNGNGNGSGNGDEGEMQVKGRRIEQLWMLRRTLRVEARRPRDRKREERK
jgi:hypothetical protein